MEAGARSGSQSPRQSRQSANSDQQQKKRPHDSEFEFEQPSNAIILAACY
jgi:hypothetical protein